MEILFLQNQSLACLFALQVLWEAPQAFSIKLSHCFKHWGVPLSENWLSLSVPIATSDQQVPMTNISSFRNIRPGYTSSSSFTTGAKLSRVKADMEETRLKPA